MKKIKIVLIIVLILSILLSVAYYLGGYKILAKKSNINVEYASEETTPANEQDDSVSSEISEELETIQGYVQVIYTIETTENLKEGWILVSIEDTLYNAYRSFQYFNENNELLSYTPQISDFPPAYTDNKGNTYCLGGITFNTEEDSSIAKYWANEITYILTFPLELIKNPPQEILHPEGEATE